MIKKLTITMTSISGAPGLHILQKLYTLQLHGIAQGKQYQCMFMPKKTDQRHTEHTEIHKQKHKPDFYPKLSKLL